MDIPVGAQGFNAARDGKNGNNVIDKVNSFTAVLKDPKASKDQRAEALMKIDGPRLIEEENQPGIATLVAVPLGAMQHRPADSQGLTWLKLSVSCVRSSMNRIFLRVLSILAMLPWMVHAARAGSNAHSNGPPDVPAYKKNKDGTPEQQFMKRHEGFVEEARKGGVDLLLVGDFLTDDWRGNNKEYRQGDL